MRHATQARCGPPLRPLAHTLFTVSLKILVPKRSDCALNLSVISTPRMPSGKPGKFSRSVVVVSWPPGATPLAIQPSSMTGCSSA